MSAQHLIRQHLLYSKLVPLALAAVIGSAASVSAIGISYADEVPNPSHMSYVSATIARQMYQERSADLVPVASETPVAQAAPAVQATSTGSDHATIDLPSPDLPPAIAGLQRDILHGQSVDPVQTSSIHDQNNEIAATPPVPPAPAPALAALPLMHPASKATVQAAPPETPAPASSVTAASEKLKQALDIWSASPVTSMSERKRHEAVVAFYAARDFAPLWLRDGTWSAQAHAALTRIAKANEDGLNLTGQHLPALASDNQEADDILLSDAVTVYAAQAAGDRIIPQDISRLITTKPARPDFSAILNDVAQAENADVALQATNPPQKGYAELRAKLAELRREAPPMAHRAIPNGPVLKVGMKDERVPLIRARFGLGIEQPDPSQAIVYDTRVAAAVADFQNSNGLPASGALTPRTIALLSDGQPMRLENEIVANMEIWRWLPRELGHDRIEVILPDFTAHLYHNDVEVHQSRVVIGKPGTPTPVFSNKVQFLIVNPYWNVPLSIVKKEMMPKFATDPDYFTRHGYELVQRGGTTYVRQPPGDANALGRIKFMFPNDQSVYMHDTPSKSLFAQSRRAYSHGCVRVDQPFKFAAAVLGEGWSEKRIRSMIGGHERTINLPEPLPIHLMYFTTTVDASGKLQMRDDIYGYMRKIKAALGLEG